MTRLWPVNPFMTRLWPVNDLFMTYQPVYDTFMTRLWPINPFITYLWRDNYIFFTKLIKWVDTLTRLVDTPTKWADTTTRIAKPNLKNVKERKIIFVHSEPEAVLNFFLECYTKRLSVCVEVYYEEDCLGRIFDKLLREWAFLRHDSLYNIVVVVIK
jgi:hypothetical protein